jgi:hypothetical protein
MKVNALRDEWKVLWKVFGWCLWPEQVKNLSAYHMDAFNAFILQLARKTYVGLLDLTAPSEIKTLLSGKNYQLTTAEFDDLAAEFTPSQFLMTAFQEGFEVNTYVPEWTETGEKVFWTCRDVNAKRTNRNNADLDNYFSQTRSFFKGGSVARTSSASAVVVEDARRNAKRGGDSGSSPTNNVASPKGAVSTASRFTETPSRSNGQPNQNNILLLSDLGRIPAKDDHLAALAIKVPYADVGEKLQKIITLAIQQGYTKVASGKGINDEDVILLKRPKK